MSIYSSNYERQNKNTRERAIAKIAHFTNLARIAETVGNTKDARIARYMVGVWQRTLNRMS